MQGRHAHQTTVSARGYLPYPLSPPYYVNRTEEYQKRVFHYAHNFFSPAEMSDLTRLEIFFVPQEAERIKRNLRRKGDFDGKLHPAATKAGFLGRQNRLVRAPANAIGDTGTGTDENLDGDVAMYANRDTAQAYEYATDGRNAGEDPHVYSERSFLRRVELFTASMFVYDCAHALLAHLHEEVVSLTAHGTQADDNLLRQIIRNVRGYTFRRLIKKGAGGTMTDADVLAANPKTEATTGENGHPQITSSFANQEHIDVRDNPSDPDKTTKYWPAKPCMGTTDVDRDYSLMDLTEPFSTTELRQLQLEGWIRRHNMFWAPTRGSTAFSEKMNSDAYARGPKGTVDASRAMGVYPVTFLTNTTIADDAAAARLIEHCNSEAIDPQFFSWGLRRQVFMPLEVDVADIYRFQDLETYDELHEALNAFSNGMFAGVSISGMWADYLRPRLSRVLTQVPMNQLQPFKNVVKHIELPAVPGEMRHTAGQAEAMRLYNKADDILSKINQWFQFGGDFSTVGYKEYRDPGNDAEKILGNNAFAKGWGQRALGISGCGDGYTAVPYDRDPSLPGARVTHPIPGADGTLLENPQTNYIACAPRAPTTAVRPSRVLDAYRSKRTRKPKRAGRR